VIHLDTHVLVWLEAGLFDRFPGEARRRLEQDDLRVSPMAVLELEYLFEIGRVTLPSADVMSHLTTSLGLRTSDEPFADVARAAVRERWTRDPFDRVLVAHARLAGASLLTKDETIRERFEGAWWG